MHCEWEPVLFWCKDLYFRGMWHNFEVKAASTLFKWENAAENLVPKFKNSFIGLNLNIDQNNHNQHFGHKIAIAYSAIFDDNAF